MPILCYIGASLFQKVGVDSLVRFLSDAHFLAKLIKKYLFDAISFCNRTHWNPYCVMSGQFWTEGDRGQGGEPTVRDEFSPQRYANKPTVRDKSTKTRKYEFSLPSGPSAKNVLFQYITHQRGGEGEKFNFTLMVESCWGHVGVMFGSCWDQLGTNLNFPFQWATLDLTLSIENWGIP